MEQVDKIKAALAAIGGALTALWGWFGWLIVAWVVCMLLDYLTGTAAALRRGEWSSSKAREGLWHKAGCVSAVTVSGILDLVVSQPMGNLPEAALPFEYTVLLSPLVLAWYILTEAGSIVENAAKLGAPIPAWLGKTIAGLKEQMEKDGAAHAVFGGGGKADHRKFLQSVPEGNRMYLEQALDMVGFEELDNEQLTFAYSAKRDAITLEKTRDHHLPRMLLRSVLRLLAPLM